MPLKGVSPQKIRFCPNCTPQPAMRCEIEMRVDELLPNSAVPFKAERASVSSLEELTELPCIKGVLDNHGKFYCFSCRRPDDHWLLMADLHSAWRVVALVSGDGAERIVNTLPVWTFSKPQGLTGTGVGVGSGNGVGSGVGIGVGKGVGAAIGVETGVAVGPGAGVDEAEGVASGLSRPPPPP